MAVDRVCTFLQKLFIEACRGRVGGGRVLVYIFMKFSREGTSYVHDIYAYNII